MYGTFNFVCHIEGQSIIVLFMRHSIILSRMSKKQLGVRSLYRLTKLTYSWAECARLVYPFMELRAPSAVREVKRSSRQRFLVNLAFGMGEG